MVFSRCGPKLQKYVSCAILLAVECSCSRRLVDVVQYRHNHSVANLTRSCARQSFVNPDYFIIVHVTFSHFTYLVPCHDSDQKCKIL